jgi:hypothetical protein
VFRMAIVSAFPQSKFAEKVSEYNRRSFDSPPPN